MAETAAKKRTFMEFFTSRFVLRENVLWRVMKLLAPVKHWIVFANILLAISSSLTAIGYVSLVPLAKATLSLNQTKAVEPETAANPDKPKTGEQILRKAQEWEWFSSAYARVQEKKAQVQGWMRESLPRFVTVYSIFLIGIVLLQGIFQFLGNLILARTTIQVTSKLLQKVYANVLNQELDFFHNTSTGYLLNICYREVFQLREIMTFLASDRVMLPVQMAIFFGALLWISPHLSFLMLILMPLVILPMLLLNRKVRSKLEAEIQEEAQTMEIMSESFHNINAVKAFGAEEFEKEYVTPSIEQYVHITARRRAAEAMTGPIVDVLNMIAILSVFVAAIFFLSQAARMDSAQLLVFMVFLQRFYRPFRSLMSMNVRMMRAVAVAKRIFRLRDRQALIVDAPDAVDFPATWSFLKFRNVSLSYAIMRKGKLVPRMALDSVRMAVNRGETVALIGRNGAGKSSVVNLICRLYDPTDGTVTIDHLPISRIKLASLREKVCLITQHPILFNRSVAENIAYGLRDVPHERIVTAARATGADGFINTLPQGYDTLIGEGGRDLSGGEKQKIALARAFVRNPEILILDEPTTGLDRESTAEFLQLIGKLRESRLMTIIYITHERSQLTHFDRVFRLNERRKIVDRAPQPTAEP